MCVQLTATLAAMKGISYELKETLILHASNIPHVLFGRLYEMAGQGYKDVWWWIITKILPLVSSAWKARLQAGDKGKTVTNNMWECVTTSDIAFVFVLVQWAAKHLVKGNELEMHKAKVDDIRWKKALAVNIKVEPGIEVNLLTGYAELDEKITDKTDEIVSSNSGDDESNDSDDSSDDEENGDNDKTESGECENGAQSNDGNGDDTETSGKEEDNSGNDKKGSKKKRGRKKGESGIASQENIELFNGYGRVLEDILDCPRKSRIAETWTVQAMKWVNREVIDVDGGDGDSFVDNRQQKRSKKQKLAPFVSKDRFGFGNTGY